MNLNEISELGAISQEALDRFVYVIGTARGGTSVLRTAINIHNGILMLPGITHFMNQVWRYRKRVHQRLLNQIFRLPSFYRESEVIETLPEETGKQMRIHINRAMESRDLRRMWQLYPLIYGLDKGNEKNLSEILCWGDKANDFYRVGKVAEYFPKGKFVFVIRDPRGAVVSLARRAYRKETGELGAGVDGGKLVESCITWRHMTQRMLRFSHRHPERTLLVKFEDFLEKPAPTLRGIFSFLQVTPMDEKDIHERLGELNYGATNEPSERGTGVSTRPMSRWKSLLNPEQLGSIKKITGKTAQRAGYHIEGPLEPQSLLKALKDVGSLKGKALVSLKLAYLMAKDLFV